MGLLRIRCHKWRVCCEGEKEEEQLCANYSRKELHHVGNTTNLLVHMQYNHAHEYSELQAGTTRPIRLRQKLERNNDQSWKHYSSMNPYSVVHSDGKKLTDAVCYCIAKDCLPLDSTGDPGFRFMLQTFDTCVFSTAGHIVNVKRASLLPENDSMLVFLAENLD